MSIGTSGNIGGVADTVINTLKNIPPENLKQIAIAIATALVTGYQISKGEMPKELEMLK